MESLKIAFSNAIDGEFVQILNCDNRHWVCVLTVGCKVGAINVYDIMCTGDVPMKTKEGIASMMTTHCAHTYMTVLPKTHIVHTKIEFNFIAAVYRHTQHLSIPSVSSAKS